MKEKIQKELKAIHYGFGQTISPEFMRRVKVESYLDSLTKNLTIAAHIKVWEEHLPEDYTHTFEFEFLEPATWFQQFKQECFPKWALRIFPIKNRKRVEKKVRTITVERWIKYPDYNPVFGEGKRDIKFSTADVLYPSVEEKE